MGLNMESVALILVFVRQNHYFRKRTKSFDHRKFILRHLGQEAIDEM